MDHERDTIRAARRRGPAMPSEPALAQAAAGGAARLVPPGAAEFVLQLCPSTHSIGRRTQDPAIRRIDVRAGL